MEEYKRREAERLNSEQHDKSWGTNLRDIPSSVVFEPVPNSEPKPVDV